MIKEKCIKPIPDRLLKRLEKIDSESLEKIRFYRYYTIFNRELCMVYVAAKTYRRKRYFKQVAVHGIHSPECLVKDIEYSWCSMYGFKVGWYAEGLAKQKTWYETSYWCTAEDRFYKPSSKLINPEFPLKLKNYKYSAIDKYTNEDKLQYLRIYEKFPKVELLVKAGLSTFATRKTIVEKLSEDKNFGKWMFKNKEELVKKSFYINALNKAYKLNKPLAEVQMNLESKKALSIADNHRIIKEFFSKNEYDTLINYLWKQHSSLYIYEDYLRACKELELNMNEDKNRYPKEFMRWHDIRINELDSKRAEIDAIKKKELFENFTKVASKYLGLERNLKDAYITIIAKSPTELVYEGEQLHHCVGKMGYDQKFAKEQSLIFFIRNKNNPDVPFVTIEYSIKTKSILQCYGYRDSKPEEEVLNYVNKVWLPYANRKLKRVA